jgi:DNA-binding NtrC family response regulator
MQPNLPGKRVLIIKGSLLAPDALEAALVEQGVKVVLATNLISAFSLIERDTFDAVVIDKGLHNEAIDLCAELKSLEVPYVMAHAPHALQKPLAQKGAAREIAAALAERLLAEQPGHQQVETQIIAARYPAVKGMASMGVIDPARF